MPGTAHRDVHTEASNVRFWGKSGHVANRPVCPLLTHPCHLTINFAVMHNAAFLQTMW